MKISKGRRRTLMALATLLKKLLKPVSNWFVMLQSSTNENDPELAADYQEEEEFRLHWVHGLESTAEDCSGGGGSPTGKRGGQLTSSDGRTSLRDRRLRLSFPHRPLWALTDLELAAILDHFDVTRGLGFPGLTEDKLKRKWRSFMSSDLCEWWIFFLLGSVSQEVMPPWEGFGRLCRLVKSHSEGSLASKAALIAHLILCRDLRQVIRRPLVSHQISRYFQKIFSTYIKYMFSQRDSNSIKWRHCHEIYSREISPFAEAVFSFYAQTCLDADILARVLHILESAPIFDDLSSAAVAFSFGYGRIGYFLPRLLEGTESMIGVVEAIFISYILKGRLDNRFQWEMLYNSKLNGESLQSMYQRVVGEKSTITLIRDSSSYIFGAYLNSAWEKGARFFGGTGSFLFRLIPDIILCQAHEMKINSNFCYFNFDDSRLPNGLAFGGTIDFFGLHIDMNTMRGKCADSCATYDNFQCLSEFNYFDVTNIEVWSVTPDPSAETVFAHEEIFPPIPFVEFLSNSMSGKCP